jgi:hypothetical protein
MTHLFDLIREAKRARVGYVPRLRALSCRDATGKSMQNPLADEMLGFHGCRIITANCVCPPMSLSNAVDALR